MNKKKEILFSLNNFLLSISTALDYVETNISNTTTNHSKRVAYIALKFAKEFNYKAEGLFDLCAYSLMHNISLNEVGKINKEYCLKADSYSKNFPFISNEKNILKYQHEFYNGSGIFALEKEQIPLLSQFISFANLIDSKFDFSSNDISIRDEILLFVNLNKNILFSEDIGECFEEFTFKTSFWLDLQNETELLNYIFTTLQDFSTVITYEELLKITMNFSKIIQKESSLVKYASLMSDFYKFEHKDKQTFLIAASLVKIGILELPKYILEKQNLTKSEFELIKAYPYNSKRILNNIMGFSDIASYVCKSQEYLDGSGYPNTLESNDLSLKDRLLSTLVIYDSLKQEKPYRKAFSKEEAIDILKDKAKKSLLDISIIEDISKSLD